MTKKLIIILNAVGVICLTVLAVIYISHDQTVNNPDAMIPMQRWEGAGFLLTAGSIPLGFANLLAFLSFKKTAKRKLSLTAVFIPFIICVILTAHFWCFSLLSDAPEKGALPVVRISVNYTEKKQTENCVIYDDMGKETVKEPVDGKHTKILTADNSIFESELVDDKVANRVTSYDLTDSNGKQVTADETTKSLIDNTAKHIPHEIFEERIFITSGRYFAAVKTNVNWQDPCELYEFYPDTQEFKPLFKWYNTEISIDKLEIAGD